MFNSGVLGVYQPLGISEDQITIASLVKSYGYASGAFGKWHVGLGTDPLTDYNGEVKPGPMEIGFSENYIEPDNLEENLYLDGYHVVNADPSDPFIWNPTEYGKTVSNYRQGITRVLMTLEGGEKARIAKKPGCTEVFTQKAVDFIGRHTEQPFLLYLAPNNVHLTIQPGEEFIGTSDCGLYGDYVTDLDWMVAESTLVLQMPMLLRRVTASMEISWDKNWISGRGEVRNAIIYKALDGVLAARQGSWVLIPVQGNGNTSFDGEHIMEFFAGLGIEILHSDYTSEGVLKPDAPPGQLYDLATDPYQTTNLYREHPEKVKELTALLEQIKNN